jgi:hypothetical protein
MQYLILISIQFSAKSTAATDSTITFHSRIAEAIAAVSLVATIIQFISTEQHY